MPDTTPTIRHFRDRLPHWQVAEHPYFITLCRKGCLPASAFLTDSASWFSSFTKADDILDAPTSGPRDLTTPAIAQTLFDSFAWLRDRGWRIWAGCIMPSHLHLVMRNTKGRNGLLTEDLGLFKNHTGRVANHWRGVEGSFWQKECFDHWCRDDEDWLGYVQYTISNPVKANLVKSWRAWRWTVVDPELENLIEENTTPGS